MSITADFSGAFKKTAALKMLPKAYKLLSTLWGADVVLALKRSAAGMQKSWEAGRPKGQMARSTDMEVTGSNDRWQVAVGTGLKGHNEIKYAKIQDEGGTIHAKDKFFSVANIAGRPRIGPFMTVPLAGTKGYVANYPGSFVIRSKKGNLVVVQPLAYKSGKRKGERKRGSQAGLKALFILKGQVTIPASHWFTAIVDQKRVELDEVMTSEVAMNMAEQLSGV